MSDQSQGDRIFVLVRCAERKPSKDAAVLSRPGRLEAEEAGLFLDSYSPMAIAMLCGPPAHVQEHAAIMGRLIETKARVVRLSALASDAPELKLGTIIKEAEVRLDLASICVLACVADEPQFSNLAKHIVGPTGTMPSLWQALVVTAPSWNGLQHETERKAAVYPFGNTGRPAESELHPKIQSKMQVSTFLAGFTFTVLSAVVTGSDY